MIKWGNRHPGSGYRRLICDVCSKMIRLKDAVFINDKYNLLNGMVVCKHDADKTNPQAYIRTTSEKATVQPKMIRPRQTDKFVYISSPSEIETGDLIDPAGRSPSAPQQLFISGASSSSVILRWFGPNDCGSSAISGYKIERESPLGGGFSTIKADTLSGGTYYEDTTASASTQYNYRVSAINKDFTGDPSNEASITTNA